MKVSSNTSRFLERNKDFAPLLVRFVLGIRLIEGTQDNILSWQRMLEFRDFLQAYHFPFPLVSACVSVYAQFFCGLALILGLFSRYAGAILIINFMVALLAVHFGTSIQESFPALVMVAGGFFFLFNGSGKFSLDNKLNRKRT